VLVATNQQEILHLQTQKMPLASDVSLDFLAMVTENYTGADPMDLCRNAAVETIKHGRDVRQPLHYAPAHRAHGIVTRW
jgi:transitional endoplasmic reticulum ATPase